MSAQPAWIAPLARSCLRGLTRTGHFVQPRAQRAASSLLRGLGTLGRALWHRRATAWALVLRAAWACALYLLWWAGREVVALNRPLALQQTAWSFGVGLLLCALVLIAARPRYLRFAAWSLGTVHGAGLMLMHALAG